MFCPGRRAILEYDTCDRLAVYSGPPEQTIELGNRRTLEMSEIVEVRHSYSIPSLPTASQSVAIFKTYLHDSSTGGLQRAPSMTARKMCSLPSSTLKEACSGSADLGEDNDKTMGEEWFFEGLLMRIVAI